MAKRDAISALADIAQSDEFEQAQKNQKTSRPSLLEQRNSVLGEIVDDGRRSAIHLSVRPEQCVMWRRHNRQYDRLTRENCADLINSIRANGQKIPAIARRLDKANDRAEYEIICGARRHFAVQYLREIENLDISYLIEIRKLNDNEAFEVSDLENKHRRDITDYERSLDYASALTEFYNGSISLMAERIGMPRQTLSPYLYMADFPKIVLDAYGDPMEVSVRHAKMLNPILKDEGRKKKVIARAKELAAEQERGFSLGKAYPYDGATIFKNLKEAAQAPAKRAASKANVQKVDFGPFGQGCAKIGRDKLVLEIPNKKGRSATEIIEKIAVALKA